MSETIPTMLQQTVWRDGDALCVWVPAESWRSALGNRLTQAMVVLGLLTSVLTLGIGLLFWLIWLPLLLALWLWVYRIPSSHRIARIRPTGLELAGPFRTRDPPPGRVVVRGELGQPCELFVGERLILKTPMSEEGPWKPTTLTWFSRELGRTLGVPVEDSRPLDEWAAWEADPVYRAATAWDVRLMENRTQFPRLHQQPLQAMQAEIDHHSMKVRVVSGLPPLVAHTDVEMTVDRVRSGSTELDLAEVVRAGWFVRRQDALAGQPADLLEFEVLTRRRWVRLFTLRGEGQVGTFAGPMSWLAREILQRAEYARGRVPADQGEASEIPEALKALGRSREKG